MNDEISNEPELNRNDAIDERKEKAAADAYVRIRSGQHWLDWMFVAEGLGVGRRGPSVGAAPTTSKARTTSARSRSG